MQEEDDFTVRYAVLLEYYGMVGTRNNRGQSHENGRVKFSPRRTLPNGGLGADSPCKRQRARSGTR